MKIIEVSIGKIKPYHRNARTKSKRAIEVVAKSIQEFGWQQPIVVDAEYVVIVGHTRLDAAKFLKLKRVPVVVADHLTPAQVAAYRLDNRTHDEGQWDASLLNLELLDLKLTGLDLTLTCFDSSEIEMYLDSIMPVFKEYDESAADDVKMHECPQCHHKWPA